MTERMKPADFVRLVKQLKELGATRVVASADGSFDVQLSGGAPKLVAVNPAAQQADRERDLREERNVREADRLKNPEEAPASAEGRDAWRKDVLRAVSSGG